MTTKLVVSGSRSIKNINLVINELDKYNSKHKIDLIVCGGAKGVDKAAVYWATVTGTPFKLFLPNYEMYGKRAPLERNEKMSAYGNELLAIWDGRSRGTIHTVECFRRLDKPVTLIDMRGVSAEQKDLKPQERVEEDMAK